MGIVDVGCVGLIWYIYSNERPKISDMSIHITCLKCARLYSLPESIIPIFPLPPPLPPPNMI